MQKFDGVDFLGIDGLFSDEEILVRDSVRRFVQDRVLPVIEKHNREGTFPADLIPEMAELGMYGANIHGYGCAGLNNVAYGLIMQELERGDSGLRSFVSVQGALCMYPIHAYGSEEQKNQWLPKMATGEVVGCFGLTEADFGSNPSGMLTTAKKDGDSYVLNGSKMWITNGGVAHIAIVWAKLDGRIRGFIVERGTKGYSTKDIHGKFSLRASVTSELTFQDCRIPASNILPNVDGLKGPLGCLNQARYGIAWGGIGAAMACYHEALEYSKTRIQFDRPIAGFQMVQEKLAWMIREITKGQLLVLQVGRLKDAGKVKPEQVSLAKMNNVDVGLQCARLARAILGANGITDEYQCGRHMCNLESVYTYEGTHDIHTLVVGEAITGIPAYK
ncbi:MAG TPA: acyl-CoA dehydrogenase family protein [Candidatus Eisenbacteria bacterium]|jgi:glutaryl-CoA dehydrogenase|nr:acyl-CoA dehydrogenase family protein [Candidatus Eisenbacteria bacterium]